MPLDTHERLIRAEQAFHTMLNDLPVEPWTDGPFDDAMKALLQANRATTPVPRRYIVQHCTTGNFLAQGPFAWGWHPKQHRAHHFHSASVAASIADRFNGGEVVPVVTQ